MSLKNYNGKSLLFINQKGRLCIVKVPFQVKCVQAVGPVQKDNIVYVEATDESDEHKIIYRTLGRWVPYYYFIIVFKG